MKMVKCRFNCSSVAAAIWLAALLVPVLRASALEQGLVAHYPFGGNANDATGRENHGNPGTAQLTADRFGNLESAYLFNGVDSFITFTNPPTMAVDELSMFCWIKPAKLPQFGIALTLGYMDGNLPCNGYGLGIGDTTSPTGQGATLVGVNACISWVDGKHHFAAPEVWHHIGLVRHSGNDHFYVNGQQVSVQAIATPSPPTHFGIGTLIGSDQNRLLFNGSIDDVRIYDRALSAFEVEQLYRFESTPTNAPLLILRQPEDQQVFPGSNAVFSVEAIGPEFLTYRWRFKGTRIIGATGPVLELNRVSAADVGEYSVEISTSSATLVSRAARLSLLVDTDGDGLSDESEVGARRYHWVEGNFSWDEARANANAKGGTLVTISDPNELQLALSTFPPGDTRCVWIGLYRTEAGWQWVNGEPASYTNWAPGQPEGGAGLGDAAGICRDGAWNDVFKSQQPPGRGPYILEIVGGTNPNNPDTDGDGFSDGDEVLKYGTRPNDKDSRPTPFLNAGKYSFLLGYRFTLAGISNTAYGIEISQDLTNWFPLIGIELTSRSQILTDGTATNATQQRFYRAYRKP